MSKKIIVALSLVALSNCWDSRNMASGQSGIDNNENNFGSQFEGFSQFPEDDGYFGTKGLAGQGKKFNDKDQGFYSGGHDDFGFDGVDFGGKKAVKKLNKKDNQFQGKDQDYSGEGQDDNIDYGGVTFNGKKLNKNQLNKGRGDDYEGGEGQFGRRGDDGSRDFDISEDKFDERPKKIGMKKMRKSGLKKGLKKGQGEDDGNFAGQDMFPGGEKANWKKVPYEDVAPFLEKKSAMTDVKPDDYKIANSNFGDLDFDKNLYGGVEDYHNQDFKGDGNDFDSAYLPDYEDYDQILAKQDQMGEQEPIAENMDQQKPHQMKKLKKRRQGKKAKHHKKAQQQQDLQKFW